jgi:hypothetical protein
MLKQPMIEKLAAMRLLGMAEALKAQEQDPSARELSFLERFGLLVDQQWNWRENQALSRRLKNAKLRTANACVEEIDYRTARGLDKSVIRSLTQQSAWVGTHENIFVLGPTGVGKSFVACALAQKACRDGYAALYTRAQSLFRDLAMARADGSLLILPEGALGAGLSNRSETIVRQKRRETKMFLLSKSAARIASQSGDSLPAWLDDYASCLATSPHAVSPDAVSLVAWVRALSA